MTNRKIVPHLWFDKEAVEAAGFYASVFNDSKITHSGVIRDTPSGDCDIVSFELRGQPFIAISAGPYFKFSPSVSFIVNFDPSREPDAEGNIDAVWERLSRDGTVLMPLRDYPWSKRYGWIQDRYGLSWQLILTNPEGEERPEILPSLFFAGDRYGMAEEAVAFYLSVFREVKKGAMYHYGAGQEPHREGTVMFADFRLLDRWFAAMDGAPDLRYAFNEAVSFIVNCDSQEEIDYYWGKLSAVPEAEQCGWLKDRYGLSWQIVPSVLDSMMKNGAREQIDRVTRAFLPMKKFDISVLEQAYRG